MKKKIDMNWFGERLKMARKINMISLRALAEKLEVSHTLLYKYEKGEILPDSSMLIKLSRALNVKVEFFFRPQRIEKIEPVYRSNKELISGKEEESIKEQIKEWMERYIFLESLYPDFFSSVPFPQYRIQSSEGVEDVAKKLRKKWDLGLDPLGNIVEILEDKGVKIGVIKGAKHFDSCAFWVGEKEKKIPVIVVKENIPGDRERFSISHELGHLVLQFDKKVFKDDKEKAINRFAGAFLVPDESVWQEIGRKRKHININELFALKMKYGLSMQGWIHRMEDLKVIAPTLARQLREEFSKRGWKKLEPGEQISFQKSTRMERLAYRALEEGIISKAKVLELVGSIDFSNLN